MDVNIILNNDYSKEEIENIFETNFGARIKGITLRKWKDNTPYIILFSRTDGPYTDRIEGSIFFYDGEGIGKDQELTAANKTLINSNQDNRVIYGFVQENQNGKWKYVGILKVLDYEYISKKGYKTFEFKLQKMQLEHPEEQTMEAKNILDLSSQAEPKLIDESNKIQINRKARDAFFSKKIKEIYDFKCAVCNKKRFTNANFPEVESAHIFPKEKDGSDDLRNGISLCKLHHWAFDGGLLSIKDDYSIIVKEKIRKQEDYKEIYIFDGRIINLPRDSRFNPHPKFLKEHRKIHGFE